jgi:hypothetical protein
MKYKIFEVIENAARPDTIIAYAMNSRYCPKDVGSRIRTRRIGLKSTNAKFVVRANDRISVDLIS